MAKKTITIIQYDNDLDFKSMIQELMNNKDETNPYRRIKSESDLVKTLLEEVLPREHKKYCGQLAVEDAKEKKTENQVNEHGGKHAEPKS